MIFIKLGNLIGKRAAFVVFILAVVYAVCSASVVRADYYSYVDKSGAVYYTNVPKSAKYKWIMTEGAGSVGQAYIAYDELIRRTSVKYGVSTSLVWAIVKAESDFDPYVVSKAGAVGLMQLMPETARSMGVSDRYDPAQNIEGGVKFLSHLLKRFQGRTTLAIAAYNAGETAVRRYKDNVPPYKETRRFVMKVNKFQDEYLKR
jgi:soluble lytic murein transglycosylase-like protein